MIKRYNIIFHGHRGTIEDEDKSGKYVKYKDHQAAIEKLRKRIAELELWAEQTIKAIQDNTVEPVCCMRAGYECCGSPEPDWPEWVTKINFPEPPKEQTND